MISSRKVEKRKCWAVQDFGVVEEKRLRSLEFWDEGWKEVGK